MNITAVVLSSALVSAVVGTIAAHLSQRRLATHQARVDYESAARRRLYEALGPLRFQLLIASRDVIRRVRPHHSREWNMNPDAYYASSFVYRLLRPLALVELVKRQMAIVDFSVDPSGRELLRFDASVYRLLTSDDPLPYHQHLDWARESQHVFRDNLRLAAIALITSDGDGTTRVMDYSEFLDHGTIRDAALEPVVSLISTCRHNLCENPVWWVRIVGYTYACRWLLETQGAELGFGPQELDISAMLRAVDDPEILAHAGDYPALFETVLDEPL